MTKTLLLGGSAARILTSYGPKPVLAPPDDGGVAELTRAFEVNHTEVKGLFGRTDTRLGEIDTQVKAVGDKIAATDARMDSIEQKMARRTGAGGPVQPATPGGMLTESAEFKEFARTKRGMARVEVKTLTSVSGSGGSLVAPDYRPDPVMMPQRPMTIRQLLAPGRTISNVVDYVVQTSRTNNAAPVAEGALKPQSDMTFTQMQANVRTIAHFIPVSRQIMDDAPALQSLIDSEMRYDLQYKEELQLLYGDGTGENLLGIVPQATAYSAPFAVTGETAIDRLLLAAAQAEAALLPATGIVLNTLDWFKIMAVKDGMGRYMVGDPQSQAAKMLWSIPIAASLAMTQGTFLVGAFRDGAQIFDRMDAEVLVSSEDNDNFRRNLLTVRCEERLAFAVKRPQAFITGSLPT